MFIFRKLYSICTQFYELIYEKSSKLKCMNIFFKLFFNAELNYKNIQVGCIITKKKMIT